MTGGQESRLSPKSKDLDPKSRQESRSQPLSICHFLESHGITAETGHNHNARATEVHTSQDSSAAIMVNTGPSLTFTEAEGRYVLRLVLLVT